MVFTPDSASLLELNFELQIALLMREVREVEAKVFACRMTAIWLDHAAASIMWPLNSAAVVDTRPFRLGDQPESDRRVRPSANHQIPELRRHSAEVGPVDVRHSGRVMTEKPSP